MHFILTFETYMLHVKYKTIETPFKTPFQTAHGIKTHQKALLISLSYGNISGLGEAPYIPYYNITIEKMIEDLQSKCHLIQQYQFTEPERFWHYCHHLFPENHFLVCALDMAYWNMYSQFKREKMHKLLNIEWKNIPPSDFTIGIDSIDNMMLQIEKNPMPIYKIKVADDAHIELLKTIRKNTNATLRIDANTAWELEKVPHYIEVLDKINIELIEQPFKKDEYEKNNLLRKITNIPIIADESCVHESDVLKCATYFDGVNIKITKCSGISPAYRMIQNAKSMGLKVLLGCMCETEIGIESMAHLLPLCDMADIDGTLLLDVKAPSKFYFQEGVFTWK